MVPWAKDRRNGQRLINKHGILFWGDENILTFDKGDGCITLGFLPLNCTF
jgi:hypothetical protein